MNSEQIKEFLDDHGIGDPAIVDLLNETYPEFESELLSEDAAAFPYLLGIASLYGDQLGAYDLLMRMRHTFTEGQLKKLYDGQLRVWRGRKDKSQHDLQYLRIVLGMKQTPLAAEEGGEQYDEDELTQNPAMSQRDSLD